MALYITETDADGNPFRTDPYTPAQPPPSYANRGAPYVTAQQTGSNPLYFLLGVALLSTAVALATIALYNQGKLDGAIAWLEARGIDVTPIVEVLESNPVGDPAVEGVEIPDGVMQPLPEPTAPPAPPAAPNAGALEAAIDSLTPQEHSPFYTWEIPALDPARPDTWPAMTEEQRAAFLQANPDWGDRVAAAQNPSGPEPVAPAPAPEASAPEAQPDTAAAPAPSILTYPTPVPQGQRGPVAGGHPYGSGPVRVAPQQPASAVPDSPVNPSYSAPQAIQPAQPFYEYTTPPSAPQAAPEPSSEPVVTNPSYSAPTGIQPAPAPGCLLEPACAASLGQ